VRIVQTTSEYEYSSFPSVRFLLYAIENNQLYGENLLKIEKFQYTPIIVGGY
jgi:hypothetical protein